MVAGRAARQQGELPLAKMQLALELLVESPLVVEEHRALLVGNQENRLVEEQEALLPLAAYLEAVKYARNIQELNYENICSN